MSEASGVIPHEIDGARKTYGSVRALDGASFERWSWFSSTNFEGASLRGTSFRECNVKCASFRHADLTGASFELAAVEATEFDGAKLEGVSFVGATCYGYTFQNGDQFPPT